MIPRRLIIDLSFLIYGILCVYYLVFIQQKYRKYDGEIRHISRYCATWELDSQISTGNGPRHRKKRKKLTIPPKDKALKKQSRSAYYGATTIETRCI